jgi:CheY-like chemotaxis protein
VAKKGFVRDMEVELVNKSGTPFQGLLTATHRHGGDGSVLGYQCVVREMSEPRKLAPPSRKSLEEDEARGHGTVLLVEPHEVTRSEVKQILELAGIRVLIGESLAEGLVIFRSRSSEIGAVVLAGSPGDIIDDEAFTEIRRIRPGARIVILCSDEPEQNIVEHLAAAGLSGIVRKPFHPLGLLQQVRDALEQGARSERGTDARDEGMWGRRATRVIPTGLSGPK